jgi:exopolysaccharide biosynthesis WecB/TagA/CpsF family protein
MTEKVSPLIDEQREGPNVTHDVFILGLPFWNPTYEEFFQWWSTELDRDSDRGSVLGFVNAHTLNQSVANPQFRDALISADLLINDGIGYRLASKMRGVPTKYNLNGTDLIPRLFAESPRPIRIFLYGAEESSNKGAADAFAKNSRVTVVGRVNGFVDVESEAIPAIQAAKPDVLLVALGHPRQELFCVNNANRLGARILVPVGGLFDFMSDTKPRAPEWIRAIGMEWAFRLSLEPKRMFARYVLGNPLFIWRSVLSLPKDRARLGANAGQF